MYCPECGVEYRQGFTECSDCHVVLVENLPPEPEVDHSGEGWETIECFAYQPGLIAVLKSVLESEGIEYFLTDENMDTLYGSLPLLRSPRLTVRREQAEQVREILAEIAVPGEEDAGSEAE